MGHQCGQSTVSGGANDTDRNIFALFSLRVLDSISSRAMIVIFSELEHFSAHRAARLFSTPHSKLASVSCQYADIVEVHKLVSHRSRGIMNLMVEENVHPLGEREIRHRRRCSIRLSVPGSSAFAAVYNMPKAATK